MKKFGVLFLIITVLAFSGTSAFAAEGEENDGRVYFEVGGLEHFVESPWATWGLRTTFDSDDTCYYDQMDETGKIIYDAIDAAVAAGPVYDEVEGVWCYEASYIPAGNQPKLDFPSADDFYNYCYGVVSAYFIDHPRESVVMDAFFGLDTRGWNVGKLTCLQIYTIDENTDTRLAKLDAAVEEFYGEFAADGMVSASELEQYRYIHDYLCGLCAYNYPALNYAQGEERYRTAHNAYGALVEETLGSGVGKGLVVCEGYADAFLLLCQRVELPCVYVAGEGASSGVFSGSANHAWNAIRLDGGWYAVDVTWDDNDFVVGDISASYCRYTYFADNRRFMPAPEGEETEIQQDHAAYSQMSYLTKDENGQWVLMDWYISSPALAEGVAEGVSEWETECIWATAPDGTEISDLNSLKWYGGSSVTKVKVTLQGDVIADATLAVPSGKTWEFIGAGGSASVFSRAEGFAGEMISVPEGGGLVLSDVTVTVASGTAVSAAGTVFVSGEVNIKDNAADLVLSGSGRIVVTGALSGEILLAGADGAACVFPADGYDWTADDRAVFDVDDPALHLSYDEKNDLLRLESLYYTAGAMPVSIGWLQADSAAALSGSPIRLRNTTEAQQTVRVFAAAYDEYGRMLQLKALGSGSITLAAGETLSGLAVPTLHENTVFCRIFVLAESGSAPLSQMAAWDFSAA